MLVILTSRGSGAPGRRSQQLDRADAAGDNVVAALFAGSDRESGAAGSPGEADPVAGAATVAAAPGADAPGAADVAASEGGESDGVVAVPPPYIQVPVDCTVPGLSVIPETVTWCPSMSVSRTVNGPAPAPEDAIQ